MITIFGSCRCDIPSSNKLNVLINYPHCTKEIIQQINYLSGNLKVKPPYDTLLFRTGIIYNTPIKYERSFTETFLNSKICVVEISSRKKYTHGGYYLHHLSVDISDTYGYLKNTPDYIVKEFVVEKQSDEEIEKDLLKIKELLSDKKILIVTHYNTKNPLVYEKRNALIMALELICKKHNIPTLNPQKALGEYPEAEILSSCGVKPLHR